jgi:hypothetical protein
MLCNFDCMTIGWNSDSTFHDTVKAKMIMESELVVENLRQAAKISAATKLYGECKFKLKLEVERRIVTTKILMDEFSGIVLQVVLKEDRKIENTTENVLNIVRVSSHPRASTGFDISRLAVAQVPAHAVVQQPMHQPGTGGRQLPAQYGNQYSYTSTGSRHARNSGDC